MPQHPPLVGQVGWRRVRPAVFGFASGRAALKAPGGEGPIVGSASEPNETRPSRACEARRVSFMSQRVKNLAD